MYTRICKRRLNKEKLATLNVELCAVRNVELFNVELLWLKPRFALSLQKKGGCI